MAIISLRDYNNLISALIDENKFDEALFHCNAVLQSYPDAIETAHLQGKTLLELNRNDEALDIFSRILAVFPDDAMAHAGLCAIYEGRQEIDKAIQHMELAFDTQPSNLAIQEELKRLYGLRDGVAPSKIRLTRGALIKMYAKGDLHQQAISESLTFLRDFPNRIDIKLLLAKMYFAQGSKQEAADLCAEILETNPDCFEANRIMDELVDQPLDDSEKDLFYRNRLISLDPYYSFIGDDLVTPADVPADKVLLEQAVYIPVISFDQDVPEWAQSETFSEKQDEGSSLDEEPSIESVIDESEIEQDQQETEPPSEPFLEPDLSEVEPRGEDDLPDWISKAGWIRATEDESEGEHGAYDESLAGEPEIEPADQDIAAPAEDLPEWLKPLNPVNSQSSDVSSQSVDDNIPEDVESSISNLADLTTEEFEKLITGDSLEEEQEQIEISQLIDQNIEDLATPQEVEKQPEDIETELPDWLKEFDVEIEPEKDDEILTRWIADEEPVAPPINHPEEKVLEPLIPEPTTENELPSDEFLPEEPVPSSIADDQSYYDKVADLVFPAVTDDQPESTQSMTEELEEETSDDAVPSWVKKILVTITPPAVLAEDKEAPVIPEAASEPIVPLISDLAKEIPHSGILSEEENIELMDWLKDTDLEIQESKGISAASDTEKSDLDQVESALAENEFQPAMEEQTLNETMDSGGYVEPPVDLERSERLIEEVLEVETAAVEAHLPTNLEFSETENEALLSVDLIDNAKYAEFSEFLEENRLDPDSTDKLIDHINDKLTLKPDEYELWQSLGDLQLSKSKFDKALEAYQAAEKILLNQ